MTRVCVTMLAAGLLLTAQPARAQGDRYATLSFFATQIYESNMFAAPSTRDAQRDLFFQLGPVIEAGRRSPALKLAARYALAAERYADHVTLNKAVARQDAVLEVHHRTSRRLELDARASYVDTHSPRELNIESGLAAGRARARRFASASAMTYDWNHSARLNLDYMFTADTLAGAASSRVHNVGFALERNSAAHGTERRRTQRRDTQRIDYRLRQFGFGDQRSEVWHVVTVGWARAITRLTTFDIALGPRLSDGTIRPEFTAVLRNRFQRGEVSTSFSRTQATAIGEQGSVELQRLAVGLVHHIRRRMKLTATPTFIHSSRDLGRVSVYAVDVEAVAQARRGLSVVASGRLGRQQGTLGGRREEIPHRSLSLGFVVTVPRSSRIEPSW